MCNRDSFILLPKTTGNPILWSLSYHHEMIIKAAREHSICTDWTAIDVVDRVAHPRHSIQIECPGGDVNKWDWDNTPRRAYWRIKNETFITDIMPFAKTVLPPIGNSVKLIEEVDLPPWLEDNLAYYQDHVGAILKLSNPLRDRQDYLARQLMGDIEYEAIKSVPELDYLVHRSQSQRAVEEFAAIVNGYKKIPGFVSTPTADCLAGYYSRPDMYKREYTTIWQDEYHYLAGKI